MKSNPNYLKRLQLYFISLITLITLTAQNSFAQGETNWIHTYDSVTSGFSNIAYDGQANLYAVGYLRPNGRAFDGLPVSGYGYEDGLLCKMDTNGHVQWLKTIGSYSMDKTKYVFNRQNNIYAGGNITNWGGNSSFVADSVAIPIPDYTSVYNGYVAQFDTAGVFQWVSFVPGNLNDIKMDIGGNSHAISSDFDSLFFDIISSTGTNLFHKGLTVSRYNGHVAPDYNGAIAIALSFDDTINFMGNYFYSSGSTDILLAQLSPVGTFMGAQVIGGSGYDFVSSLFTDSAGNLIIEGTWSSSVNCLGTTITGVDNRFFFLSIDPSGNINSYDDNDFRFLNYFTIPSNPSFVENANHEFMTVLHFADTVISGNDTLTTRYFGGYEGAGLILKYDINGQLMWYRKFAESANSTNTGHSSLFLSNCDQNRNFVCGQMNEHLIVDSLDCNVLNMYIAFTGQIVDTTYDLTLGIHDFENTYDDNVFIFPNPTTGKFTINWPEIFNIISIEILDMNGRIIFSEKLSSQQRSYSLSQNEIKLSAGIYFIKLISEDRKVVKKLSVK